MNLYDYLIENFKADGEPILVSELPCNSKGYLRQQLKELVDQGKLWRFMPGIYYLPFKNSMNNEIIDEFNKKTKTVIYSKNKEHVEKYNNQLSQIRLLSSMKRILS